MAGYLVREVWEMGLWGPGSCLEGREVGSLEPSGVGVSELMIVPPAAGHTTNQRFDLLHHFIPLVGVLYSLESRSRASWIPADHPTCCLEPCRPHTHKPAGRGPQVHGASSSPPGFLLLGGLPFLDLFLPPQAALFKALKTPNQVV